MLLTRLDLLLGWVLGILTGIVDIKLEGSSKRSSQRCQSNEFCGELHFGVGL